jgi:hypothetical protein
MKFTKKQLKIWEKNLKQGYRFFQPHNALQQTPRTMREVENGYKVANIKKMLAL